ncbi:DUF1173 family protein [Castellaniella sp.]|uniref:DUF1173 family protein n=1 Tax=Castellaniella sp. TaxID=1955812 RepID=UPI002AFE6F56|nr:DUF1173 family protein [Castellaniella sp.]
MGQDIFPVIISLGGESRRFSPDFQSASEHAPAWKHTLLKAHGQAIVSCCCQQNDQPRRLSVKYHSKSDSFFLAKFPETGHQHDPDCQYYSPDPSSSGIAAYQPGVVEELPNGNLKIKLKVGLQGRGAADDDKTPPRAPTKSKPSPNRRRGKPAVTLLGLLHLIWTAAGFNRWSPSMACRRNLSLVMFHLAKAASKIEAGRVPLASALLLATHQADSDQAEYNKACAVEASKNRVRIVAIAPLAKHKDDYEDVVERPPIQGFNGFPYLAIDDALWSNARKRFESACSAWRDGARVMAILQLDVPKAQRNGQFLSEVIDIALMRVSDDWIPVDSGYEDQAAGALVAQHRRFEKPLRFDSDADAVFPDFWLQDIGRDFPMEVWGMLTPEYLERKAEKIMHYDTTYGPQPEGWWGWNAAAEEPIPTLPQKP